MTDWIRSCTAALRFDLGLLPLGAGTLLLGLVLLNAVVMFYGSFTWLRSPTRRVNRGCIRAALAGGTPHPRPLSRRGRGGQVSYGMGRFPRQEGTRRARELRRRSTPEEQALWERLRNRRLGVIFRRQQPLGFYIADFACFERKLVIELDGAHHAGSEYDQVRDAELNARDFRVLRFWNTDVRNNLEGVLRSVADALAL